MQLRAEKVSFKYNDEDDFILKNVDFTINEGEIVGLVAPSGYGKTTLAKILAGYKSPNKGKVVLEDGKDGRYNQVQLIFQHPEKAVNPKWKMRDILNEAYTPSKKLLNDIGIEDEWLNRWPNELSGGELQRFCVARALSPQTKFLIADEMTTMLDAITQAQILNVVLDIVKKQNIGLVVISHEKAILDKICDRLVDLTKFQK
ncbi:ABC transporter ATP-binding protein [Faecalimicrobium sp. JNUCC 81]